MPTRLRQQGTIQLGQRQYVANLLERIRLSEANPARLPQATVAKLTKECNLLPPAEHKTYQEIVGSQLYLATCTRPDISLVVGRLSRFMSAPTAAHLALAKRELRYLEDTATLALTYGERAPVTGYHDSDYAGDVDTRRSTTGYIFAHTGSAVSWLSKRRSCVTLSTSEAEYVAGSTAAREAVWLRLPIRDLTGIVTAIKMRCDSASAIAMMNNITSSSRTRQIDVGYHYVRERVSDKTLIVSHVPLGGMIADALTKALQLGAFLACRTVMGLQPAL